MGNFEKLSVLVIVVIIVMILVVALYTWTDKPSDELASGAGSGGGGNGDLLDNEQPWNVAGPGKEIDVEIGDDPDRIAGKVEDEDDEGKTEFFDDERGLGNEDDDVDSKIEDEVKIAEANDTTVDEEWVYEIQRGDTLGHVAARELGTTRRTNDILAINPGLDPRRLQIGQKLRMPARGMTSSDTTSSDTSVATDASGTPIAGGEYVTQRGDTFESIAKRAHGSNQRWPEIYAKNSGVIRDPFELPAGVKIIIPR